MSKFNTKFQLRRDRLENWNIKDTNNDFVPEDGEPILVKVDNAYKLKIGDGETHFKSLEYYGDSAGEADWETLLNKPFGEIEVPAEVLTPDFTSENVLTGTLNNTNIKAISISDTAYNTEELKSLLFSYTVERNGESTVTKEFITLSDESFQDNETNIIIYNEDGTEHGWPIFASVLQDGVTVNGINTEKKGLYVLHCEIDNYATWEGTSVKIPAHIVTKQIDTKYIDYDWENIENKPFGETPFEDWEIRMPDNPNPEDIVITEQEDSVQNWKITRLGDALSDEDFNALQGVCKSQFLTTENNNVSSEFVQTGVSSSSDSNSNRYYLMNYNNVDARLINYINTSYLDGYNDNIFTTAESGLYLLQYNRYNYDTDTSIEIKPIAFYASQEDYDNDNSSYIIDYSNANEIYNYEKTPNVTQFIWASDKYLTKKDFYKSKAHFYQEDWEDGQKRIQSMDVSPTMINYEDFSVLYETPANGINTVFIDDGEGVLFAQEDNLSIGGITFPKAGAYLSKEIRYVSINGNEEQEITYIEPFRSDVKEIKTIDEKFLQIPWSHVSDPPFGETHIYELEFHGPDSYTSLNTLTKISLSSIGLSGIEYYKIGDFTSLDNLTLTRSYIQAHSLDDYGENGGIKNEFSYSFLDRKIKNSEFEDMMRDGSIFFLNTSNTSWNKISPMDSIPAIIITTTENADLEGVIFPEPGIYGAHIWKETTGQDDDKNEVTITKHQWIYEWEINSGDVIKTIDSKYLSGISYPSLSQSPVTFGYIPYDDYQNVQTISLNEWTSNEFISNGYYYTKIVNADFNLNEAELFSAIMDYGSTQDQNSVKGEKNLYLKDNFEIYTELLSNQSSEKSYATIYYGFQLNNTTSYADFIYVKIDNNNDYYSGNIYYDINNFSNHFYFSGQESTLYLLRHTAEENKSTTYSGIYQLRQGSSGTYVKKLSPRLLPSFIKAQGNESEQSSAVSWNDLTDKPFGLISMEAAGPLSSSDSTSNTTGSTTLMGMPLEYTVYKVSEIAYPLSSVDYITATLSGDYLNGDYELTALESNGVTQTTYDNGSYDYSISGILPMILSVQKPTDFPVVGRIEDPGMYVIKNILTQDGNNITYEAKSITIAQHEATKQIDKTYIDYNGIDYQSLSNKPFGVITPEAFTPIQLSSGFENLTTLSIGNDTYYKISDTVLSYEQLCGIQASYSLSINANGEGENSDSYYSTGSNAKIKIKEITGTKNQTDFAYCAAYIPTISQQPMILSLPNNFDGYIQYIDNSGVVSQASTSVSTGGVWVKLDKLSPNMSLYQGIYQINPYSWGGNYYKTISDKFLDFDQIDYNKLKNKPYGELSSSKESQNLKASIVYNDAYSFYVNNSDAYYYYIGPGIEDEADIGCLVLQWYSSITPSSATGYSSSNYSQKKVQDLILKKFPNYWAVYDNTVSTTIPILVSFIYNSSSQWYTNQEGTQSSYLSNNIKAGTYVYLAKDTTTTPITYSGITNYYPSGTYLKKIESKYLDLSDLKLTPTTKVSLPFEFSIENVQDNAGYNYTINNNSTDSYFTKMINCSYSTSSYGLARVIFIVSQDSYLHVSMKGSGSSSYTYISNPVLLENDTGCPFGANTNSESSYWYYTYNTQYRSTSSTVLSPGTYVLYIKHRQGNPSAEQGYINIKLSANSSLYNTDEITEQIIPFKEYVQQIVNEMFENGNGGSF